MSGTAILLDLRVGTLLEEEEEEENEQLKLTIAVYSPTNITSLFYPVSKFSYFCICHTPLIATILPIKVIHSDIMPCVAYTVATV